MSRRIWLVVAIVVLVAASFAVTGVAARRASEQRPRYVTQGLDYLHARQRDDGGFASPANTAWAVLGAVASGERMGSSAWTKKGKNPFDYLQSTDQVAAAASSAVPNAPIYYARMIMAYVAMDRAAKVGSAGSKGVNLLTLLYSYQDAVEGSPTKGSFSPLPSTSLSAARTTSWALLALYNLGVSSDARFLAAETWLAAQQNANGGFPTGEKGDGSNVVDTAAAMQALVRAPAGVVWDKAAARAYLKGSQNADGGFPGSPGERTDAEATSAAIQAILAIGERPEDAAWRVGVNSPIDALGRLQQSTGAYRLTSRARVRPLQVTSWALVAMRRRSFSSFPKSIGPAEKPFKFRPEFKVVSPKNGTKFKYTHIVLIRATYTDHYPKGTGINPPACRLYVDGVNKSGPAKIGDYGLTLQLKNVANGDHTYKIELRDKAGNAKIIERKFTVAVPTPTPTPAPTTQPTYNPGPVYPTTYPTSPTTPKPYVTPTPTPTPTPTVTAYPYTSPTPTPGTVTGSPIPSPSASASPAGGGAGDGGSAAGFVGGTLLAMLPIGAVISYLLLHRREELLSGASQGAVLAGGGSSWERFKKTLAGSKDLTRPSARE